MEHFGASQLQSRFHDLAGREMTDQDFAAWVAVAALGEAATRAKTCLYTQTPDSQFVFDAHPVCARVLIVSPCSGHGFKHSAAIGEAVAERVLDGASRLDLSSFALGRFGA